MKRGSGTTETFTIRKMSGNIGVERIFLKPPFLHEIKVIKQGAVEVLEYSTSEKELVSQQES